MRWKTIIERVAGRSAGSKMSGSGGVYFEDPPRLEPGLVVQWSVGPDAGRVDLADALIADATAPGEVEKMVRFCARKKLPVGVWLLSGVWCLPTDVDAVARWVLRLSERAGDASIWVDPFAMPPAYRRRLRAHLCRAGANLNSGASVNPGSRP